jgi:hypothetical protein
LRSGNDVSRELRRPVKNWFATTFTCKRVAERDFAVRNYPSAMVGGSLGDSRS